MRVARNATYGRNLQSLENLVLVLFAKDKTVVPKESSWFGSEAIPDETWHVTYEDGDKEQIALARLHWPSTDPDTIVPMRLQPLYTEDWIGLRALDERGAVHLESCPGEHMELQRSCWEWIVRKFCGEKL